MSDVNNTKSQQLSEFDKLWDYNNPAGTEKKFRALIPDLKHPGKESIRLQLLPQNGRTLSLQMKFENAHKVLDEIEPGLQNEDFYLEKIRSFLESPQRLKLCSDHFKNIYKSISRHIQFVLE